jgi:predicted porin
MKKSLLALAAMGAFAGTAHAQSSVSVYGLIDMGFTSTSTDTTTRASQAVTNVTATDTGNNGRMSGSRLGFRGVEDLGGGTSAGFVLELGPDFTEQQNGINTGTRLGFLSLSNKQAGGLHIGRQVSATKLVNDAFTAFGNANFVTGSVTGAGLNTTTVNQAAGTYTAASNAPTQGGLVNANGGERISNLIRYTTPDLIPGLSANVGVYKNTSNSTAAASIASSIIIGDINGEGTDIGARFTRGAFDAAVGYSIYNTTNGLGTDMNNKNSIMSLGASFDAKVAKAFVAYNKRTYEVSTTANSEVRFTDITIGINAPLGKANLLLAYGTGNDDSATIKTDKRGIQVGAVYNFSKRTNIYAVYGNGNAESSSATVTNSKVTATGTAIGVRHSF